jgi:hypothetical protein
MTSISPCGFTTPKRSGHRSKPTRGSTSRSRTRDGGTGYERGPVGVELTYLTSDDTGRISIPLRDGDALWSEEPLGNEVRELLGVRARVIPLALLRAGKSSPRHDHDEAAKDRADFQSLSRLRS